MPQLSLYLDDDIYRELETRARLNKTSVSKFMISALKSYFSKSLPVGFQDIFGSIRDESFVKQEAPDWCLDMPREKLTNNVNEFPE